MTEATSPTPPASIRPDDLSIVLFGMPAAGKSSLLGALAQAAQAQEHLLNGRLTDVSHGLDELRRRVYDESPRRTAEEVVPYPVDFEPFNQDGQKNQHSEHVGAVVIDCDGRVANDLLVRRQALPEDSPEGTLAHEVVTADTLVLVIDASAPAAQVEADFAEFDRFLRQLETSRSQRAEVGGLPVFLVLTKCDLLARQGDKAADWMDRIEQHKRDVDARFRSFLARREQEAGPLPFGRIDLHLWATAVKRPALAGSSAKAREPYGVAELFRQCLEQAVAFRKRQRQSGRRLLWTVGGAAGIVALMASLAVSFTLKNRDTQASALRSRVETIVFADLPTPGERLHAPIRELRTRAQTLAALHDDPQFGSLPAEQQQLVRDRLDELNSYLHYFDRLRQSPRPQDVHAEPALHNIRESLQTDLKLPSSDWAGTDAGQLYATRVQDTEALDTAVKRTRNWYLDHIEKADALWTFKGQQTGPESAGINWDSWTREVESLLSPQRRPPRSGSDTVLGAATTLTYDATVLRFDEVLKVRTVWEADQRRLQRVLDLSAAIGLAPAVDKRPPVLVIPRQFNLDQARERRKALLQHYPNYQSDFILDRVPDAIRAQVRQVAQTHYGHLLGPGQAAVLSQLQQAGGGSEETRSRWESVRNWLRAPRELEDWRVLAVALVRLHDPEAGDPVTALAGFLDKTSFTLDLRRLTLEVPESLGVRPTAEASLSLYHPASSGEKPAVLFEQSGEGERDARRRVWIYQFRPIDGQRLTYHPGDALWASLPLRDDLVFTWVRSHSLMYQFERLARPPRLHKSREEASAGTLEEKVHLTITPSEGLPRLPDLLPVVRLE
jgi:GTP-binding protein EngB required for normal cell division